MKTPHSIVFDITNSDSLSIYINPNQVNFGTGNIIDALL